MKVGYIRVSTEEQNLERQEEWVKSQSVEKVFSEKVSGKNTQDREEYKKMLDFVREGDVLYVESFSRLSRSTRDLLNTMDTLKEKGVKVVSQKENIDTTTPQGELIFTIFAALAQFEREVTMQRMREGIAIAKAKGKYKGRKPLPITEELRESARLWSEGQLRLKDAIKRSNVSEATFFRKCKQMGIRKEAVL